MISPASLDFPPLDCRLDHNLGDYYQDFAPAIRLVEAGYHGDVDPSGVPLQRLRGNRNVYNATVVAQYALANIIAYRRGARERLATARIQLEWLVSAQERTDEFAGCWLMRYDDANHPWLKAPWTSAITSGTAISALLRGAELFGDGRYRAAALAAYRSMHIARPQMALCLERGADLWYEEYPAVPPLHVLNGHAYALLGVADYARVTRDPEADARWRRAAVTLLSHIEEFDLGYWSAYDLRSREPVSVHYQKNIHVPLLRILATLVQDAGFATVADRWEQYTSRIRSRIRFHAELRLRGWRSRRQALDQPARLHRDRVRVAAEPAPSEHADRVATLESSISLRPFPYPFRAALSICNDADLLTAQNFRRLYRFLCTDSDTEWGPGLGMNIGGSFFMFRSPDSPNEFTVFDRLTTTITSDGEYILECARRGSLDVLHTYGCFTEATHFTRRLAEAALDVLCNYDVKLETWVNHGPRTNTQCVGAEGDTPGTPAYHADLTIGYGFRWVWTASDITDRIALDPRERTKPRGGGRQGANGLPGANSERLIEPYRLRDGQFVRRFYRYGGLRGQTPVLEDLPRQLSAAHLDALVRAGGYVIVYQHLAVRRLRPGFGVGKYGPVDTAWFAPEELVALRRLARRHHDGEIWVLPTTRLLRYREIIERVRWHVRRVSRQVEIVIGSNRGDPFSLEQLADLTFYCEQPETVRVRLETADGLTLVESTRANPPDETSRPSITILAHPDASSELP
jgi:hypothetical protein